MFIKFGGLLRASVAFKRFLLSVFLFSMLTSTCWAADVNDAAGLQTQVGTEGNVINITADITLSNEISTLTISKSVTINGNGNTLKGNGNNSVIHINNGATNVIIKNLIITDGRGTEYDEGSDYSYGGGICVAANNGSSDVSVERCTFVSNMASGDNNYGSVGGEIIVLGFTSGYTAIADVTNCTFTGNSASNSTNVNNALGGGIGVCTYVNDAIASADINYCTFVSNTAAQDSEVFVNGDNAHAEIRNSIICGTVSGDVTSSDCISLDSTPTSESAHDQSGKVTHTVFRKHAQLSAAVDKGTDPTVTVDQLSNDVTNKHDIGAVEIEAAPNPNSNPAPASAPTPNNTNPEPNQEENNSGSDQNGGVSPEPEPQTTPSRKGMFNVPNEKLIALIADSFKSLLQSLPNGVQFFSTLENVTVLNFDLSAFIISIEAKLNGTLLSIVAHLSPIQVSVPGVYLMKVIISNDQRNYNGRRP